uniref:SCP domain-containing protein n=1 Tax=Strongyloides papillosus TaxID=174720 RepID=A0A0N5BLQ5_STREA
MRIAIIVYVSITVIINLVKTQELAVTYMTKYKDKHRKIYLYRNNVYSTMEQLIEQVLKNHHYIDRKYLLLTNIPSFDDVKPYNDEEQIYRNIFTKKFLNSKPPLLIEEYYIRKSLKYVCNGRIFTSYNAALKYVIQEKLKNPIKHTRRPPSAVFLPLEKVNWAKEKIYCKKFWLILWKSCNYYCYSRKNFEVMKQKFLSEINYYREKYGVKKLVESPRLSSYAYKYLKEVVPFRSSMNITNFENVGKGSLTKAPLIINNWFGEHKNYKFNTPFGSTGTRHFTAMVWKSVRQIGIGIFQAGEEIYVKLIYDKTVNLPNQFETNVLKKVSV